MINEQHHVNKKIMTSNISQLMKTKNIDGQEHTSENKMTNNNIQMKKKEILTNNSI